MHWKHTLPIYFDRGKAIVSGWIAELFTSKTTKEKIDLLSKIQWLMSHLMLFYRGSAAITDWLIEFLAYSSGLQYNQWKNHPDRLALCTSLEDFQAKVLEFTKSKPMEIRKNNLPDIEKYKLQLTSYTQYLEAETRAYETEFSKQKENFSQQTSLIELLSDLLGETRENIKQRKKQPLEKLPQGVFDQLSSTFPHLKEIFEMTKNKNYSEIENRPDLQKIINSGL